MFVKFRYCSGISETRFNVILQNVWEIGLELKVSRWNKKQIGNARQFSETFVNTPKFKFCSLKSTFV